MLIQALVRNTLLVLLALADHQAFINGFPTPKPAANIYTFTPSPDSVDEFKVVTFPFSAEFGHIGGRVLLATTRHGANNFHGSL